MCGRTFSIKYKRFLHLSTFVWILSVILLTGFFVANAEYERYATGETAVIGDFVYDDDFVATTTAGCTLTIYDPSGSTIVNNGAMTANANGWTYYNYAIPSSGPEGVWPAFMKCGNVSNGDLVKQDKTFVVGATIVSTTTMASSVWTSTTRTLTAFGSLVADIWNNSTRTLTGAGLDSGSLATLSDLESASTSLASSITSSQTAINANVGSEISGAITSINTNTNSASTSLGALVTTASTSIGSQITGAQTAINANTTSQVGIASTSLGTLVTTASTSLASVINANTNSQITSAISTINTNTNATVLTASTSLLATIPTAVWGSTSRSLTTFGTLAADVWTNGTRSLTTSSSGVSIWSLSTSDFDTILAGGNYLATVFTTLDGKLVDSINLPTVTVYDPSRNVVVNAVNMTRTSVGTYTYSYTTAVGAAAGNWETVFNVTPDSGVNLSGNDYWTISSSPAQVIINSIIDSEVPQILADVTITNEGLSGYEYQYEWCVVSDINNSCGGGDDVFHAIAAKYINSGEDFNTTLTADVPTVGNYYFKVIVYFGTDSSGASRSFTATQSSGGVNQGGGSSGGGSSGGGGGGGGAPTITPPVIGKCGKIADFNCDGKVNSIDFSILLFFWKKKPPFANQYVDINKDAKIDSVDFSILLFHIGKK